MTNPARPIKIMKLDPSAVLPSRATEGSAALDLHALSSDTLMPDDIVRFHTGIAIELPFNYCGLVLSRSGLAHTHGIVVTNQPGLIDADYRGEVMVSLHNVGGATFVVKSGQRIAQLLVMQVPLLGIEVVETLSETARGVGGFGHSGT